MSTCQHCDQPVTFGQTEHGYRGHVHEATGTTICPATGEDSHDRIQAEHDAIVNDLLDAGWSPEHIGID